MTRHLSANTIVDCLNRMSLEFAKGRSAIAQELSAISKRECASRRDLAERSTSNVVSKTHNKNDKKHNSSSKIDNVAEFDEKDIANVDFGKGANKSVASRGGHNTVDRILDKYSWQSIGQEG